MYIFCISCIPLTHLPQIRLKWVSEIRPEIWYLDVMTMVYQSVVSCRSLGVASGEDIYVQILSGPSHGG